MSSTNNQTRYDFSFGVFQDGAGQSEGSFTLWSNGGANDAAALAIYEAFQGVSWNAGSSAQINVSKTVVSQTSYEPDLTTTPPSFT